MIHNELCLKTERPINHNFDSHCFGAGVKVSALIQFVHRNMNAVEVMTYNVVLKSHTRAAICGIFSVFNKQLRASNQLSNFIKYSRVNVLC